MNWEQLVGNPPRVLQFHRGITGTLRIQESFEPFCEVIALIHKCCLTRCRANPPTKSERICGDCECDLTTSHRVKAVSLISQQPSIFDGSMCSTEHVVRQCLDCVNRPPRKPPPSEQPSRCRRLQRLFMGAFTAEYTRNWLAQCHQKKAFNRSIHGQPWLSGDFATARTFYRLRRWVIGLLGRRLGCVMAIVCRTGDRIGQHLKGLVERLKLLRCVLILDSYLDVGP